MRKMFSEIWQDKPRRQYAAVILYGIICAIGLAFLLAVKS